MAKLVWPCCVFSGIHAHAHASVGMAPNFPQQKPIPNSFPTTNPRSLAPYFPAITVALTNK
jgi:hypothetical protein